MTESADRLHVVVRSPGTIYDALWDLETPLHEAEQALLATPAVARLHGVVHAGASALTTAQTYSRLEHTLGVFSLTAHFAPDDLQLRRGPAARRRAPATQPHPRGHRRAGSPTRRPRAGSRLPTTSSCGPRC